MMGLANVIKPVAIKTGFVELAIAAPLNIISRFRIMFFFVFEFYCIADLTEMDKNMQSTFSLFE